MKTFETLRRQLAAGEFEFSRHAFKRAVERSITDGEIRQAGAEARVIEQYFDDKYSPSGLLFEFSADGRPLHLQVSCADTDLIKIITLYEPDASEWVDFSQRR